MTRPAGSLGSELHARSLKIQRRAAHEVNATSLCLSIAASGIVIPAGYETQRGVRWHNSTRDGTAVAPPRIASDQPAFSRTPDQPSVVGTERLTI